jgi:hypothetical protein
MTMRIWILVLLSLVSFSALAGMPCQKGIHTDSLIQTEQVALQFGGDERETPAEYDSKPGRRPGDFMRKYGATVRVECPFGTGSANVVYVHDLLVTAAHVFQHKDPENNEKCLEVTRQELDQCKVLKMDANDKDPNSQYQVDVDSITHPLLNGDCTTTKNSGDEITWFRVKRKIRGVDPYEISHQGASSPQSMQGMQFSRVAAFALRFKGHPYETASIAENTLLAQVSHPKNFWYITAGSMTEGNSGGGDFIDNPDTGKPEIFAVMSKGKDETRDGVVFSQSNYNVHSAIQGPIAQMIQDEAGRPYASK